MSKELWVRARDELEEELKREPTEDEIQSRIEDYYEH